MKPALGALVLAMAAACALTAPIECDDSEWEPGMRCEAVIAVAQPRLAGTPGIARLTAVPGIHCPSAPASCPFTPFVVTVYADLVDGRRLYVMVGLEEDGSLSAQPAQAVEHGP